MKNFKDKTCACGTTFKPIAPAELRCSSCKSVRYQELKLAKKEVARVRRRKAGCKIGQGAPKGAAHPNYKHGLYVSQTQTREYKAKVRYCERCELDLHSVSRWHWVTHHKDHNHANHDESNLELLCKSCHAKEHEVITHLQGATTISKESTLK